MPSDAGKAARSRPEAGALFPPAAEKLRSMDVSVTPLVAKVVRSARTSDCDPNSGIQKRSQGAPLRHDVLVEAKDIVGVVGTFQTNESLVFGIAIDGASDALSRLDHVVHVVAPTGKGF
jgi:hypothetical protein